jgi:hypothetical protein
VLYYLGYLIGDRKIDSGQNGSKALPKCNPLLTLTNVIFMLQTFPNTLILPHF